MGKQPWVTHEIGGKGRTDCLSPRPPVIGVASERALLDRLSRPLCTLYDVAKIDSIQGALTREEAQAYRGKMRGKDGQQPSRKQPAPPVKPTHADVHYGPSRGGVS